MKKFVVASFALTALIAAPAVAADLGVKAPSVPYVPPLSVLRSIASPFSSLPGLGIENLAGR